MNRCVWFSFEWGRQFIFSCHVNQAALRHTNRDTLLWCSGSTAFFFLLSWWEIRFQSNKCSVIHYGVYARENQRTKFHDNHSTYKCTDHGKNHA